MPSASDITGVVFKNGTCVLLARVVDENAEAIVQSALSTIKYSIFQLSEINPDSRTAVTGHTDVSLTIADVIFNTLQTDDVWTVDQIGYNFRHVVDVTTHPAFAVAGVHFLVESTLTPTTGQPIKVRFNLEVI